MTTQRFQHRAIIVVFFFFKSWYPQKNSKNLHQLTKPTEINKTIIRCADSGPVGLIPGCGIILYDPRELVCVLLPPSDRANNMFLNASFCQIIRTQMRLWSVDLSEEFIFMRNNVLTAIQGDNICNLKTDYECMRQRKCLKVIRFWKYREQMALVPCNQSGTDWQLVQSPSTLCRRQVARL